MDGRSARRCRLARRQLSLLHRDASDRGHGGYADYMIAATEALARIPQELSAVEAAPLMRAGVTTFNA